MKVLAQFTKDGRFTIDLEADRDHLGPGPAPLARLVDGARGAFDGEPARWDRASGAEARSKNGGSRVVAVRLTGAVPPGTRSFTWSNTLASGSYLLGTTHEGDARVAWQWVEGTATSEPVTLLHSPPPLSRPEVVRRYLAMGFTHIVPSGLDHILFVLGLFFLSLKPRPILAQVTAFTCAHSITLGLTIYGVVSLSPRIVEPLIAISIVFVTVENLVVREVGARRIAVVFAFGLLHGMGFAGALGEMGLPRSEFLTALVSFNLGVEAGQLAVIGLAFAAVGAWFGQKIWYRARLAVPASVLIAAVGLYWTVERLWLG